MPQNAHFADPRFPPRIRHSPTQVDELSKEFAARADLPAHVVQMINNFPAELHPMAQLSAGESRWPRCGPKPTYWPGSVLVL